MGVPASELAEAMAVVAALPGDDWSPAGDPLKPYGLNYRISGGIRQVGGDGSIEPELVRFILIAHSILPRLLEENQALYAEVERLKAENKKLRTAKRAAANYMEGTK